MIRQGDAIEVLKTLADQSVHCCVTSPPYWGLRDYGDDAQLGLEATPEEYVGKMVAVFREVRRVLRDDGTLFLNLGDSYRGGVRSAITCGTSGASLKPKDLVGIPWRVAFALQADGWYLRSDIIWAKPNPMPESVTDRPTKSHEYLFLLSKQTKYYYDAEAIAEPSKNAGRVIAYDGSQKNCETAGDPRFATRITSDMTVPATRNKRSVWTVATQPYSGAHFAVFPPKLIEPCIRAGCPADGTVLDPFAGSGTTGAVAKELGRDYVLIELSAEYIKLANKRINETETPLFPL
jgi:DNA modification methylase